MIGKKSLAEIRDSLREACQQAAIDPDEWIAEQLRKLDSKSSARPHEIETLELIRSGLRARSSTGKRPRKKISPTG